MIWSELIRFAFTESNFPGPNKYKIDKDLIWKDKTITIKGKRKINPEIQNKSNGTAIYNVTHGNLGTVAPRHTIGRKVAICSGPPNSLVQAVDTFGKQQLVPANRIGIQCIKDYKHE